MAISQYTAWSQTEKLLNSSCDLARARYMQVAAASARAAAACAPVAVTNGKSGAHTLPALA